MANRPSQPHLEWVKNSKGERVRNDAYDKNAKKKSRKKSGDRDVVRDVFFNGQERVETTISPGTARNYIESPEHDGYGKTRLYGTIGEGESKGQTVAIKSAHHLDRFKYSKIEIKGPADEIRYVNSQYNGDRTGHELMEEHVNGIRFHNEARARVLTTDTSSIRDIGSGSLEALSQSVNRHAVDGMTDKEVKELWASAAESYGDTIQHEQLHRWEMAGSDPDTEPTYIDMGEYAHAIATGDEVPRAQLKGEK